VVQKKTKSFMLLARQRFDLQLKHADGIQHRAGKRPAVFSGIVQHQSLQSRFFLRGLLHKGNAPRADNALKPGGMPAGFLALYQRVVYVQLKADGGRPGDEIQLPKLKEAQKTTAEAELGIIIGKDCRDVSEENWQDAIVGYTTILDMTEESILKGNDYVSGNPRYLTIVKNFPTFFSFGPQLVTPDEVPDVLKLNVQSIHNGEVHAENVVANMTHRPARLVSLHSSIQG